jgi:hypothetical protein
MARHGGGGGGGCGPWGHAGGKGRPMFSYFFPF